MTHARTDAPSNDMDHQVVGHRIIAAVIDLVVLVIVFVVMSLSFGDTRTSSTGGSLSLTGGPFLLYLVLAFLYYTIPEAVFGRTLGKLVTGIRVIRDDGAPCTLRDVLLRNALRVVDGLPVFSIAGLICIAITDQKQRIGDLSAGTLVVRSA